MVLNTTSWGKINENCDREQSWRKQYELQNYWGQLHGSYRGAEEGPAFYPDPVYAYGGDHQFVDDKNFNQKEFLKIVKESPECPKTACPSPETFKEAYCCEEENVFVITISSHLSGCYNSAVLAKNLYEEEFGTGKKNIVVIDSESASTGEVNLALYVQELCEQDIPFEEIVKKTLEYRDRQKTYFVLETLDTLRKNGATHRTSGVFATKLNIKPVMGADHGVIIKLDQARRNPEGTSENGGDRCERCRNSGR